MSDVWLNRLRVLIQHSDYWQTSENLWQEKSGIITDLLDNHVPRGTGSSGLVDVRDCWVLSEGVAVRRQAM